MVLRCTANGREEAVSIMDLQDLREKGKNHNSFVSRFGDCRKTGDSMCIYPIAFSQTQNSPVFHRNLQYFQCFVSTFISLCDS